MIYYDQYGNMHDTGIRAEAKAARKVRNSKIGDTVGNVAGAAETASGLGGMFANLKDWGSKAAPNAKSELGGFFKGNTAGAAGAGAGAGGKSFMGLSLAPEGFDWSSKSGAKLFGKNIGKAVPWITGALGAVDAASGLADYANVQEDNDALMSKIQALSLANPIASSYLSSDQMALLNKIKRGGYSDDASIEDVFGGVVKGLPSTLLNAGLGLASGGVPGAIVGGVSGLVNSGIDSLSSASSENTAELQALYQALADAEAQYRAMKRPNFTGLGIQQQYQNMYA